MLAAVCFIDTVRTAAETLTGVHELSSHMKALADIGPRLFWVDCVLVGMLYLQVAQSRGRRCSAASSYLKEAMGRKNLDVQTSAQITKVGIL